MAASAVVRWSIGFFKKSLSPKFWCVALIAFRHADKIMTEFSVSVKDTENLEHQ